MKHKWKAVITTAIACILGLPTTVFAGAEGTHATSDSTDLILPVIFMAIAIILIVLFFLLGRKKKK